MTAAPAPEARKLRWRGLVFALIAFIVVSAIPVLGFYAPVKAWHVMLTTIIAALFLFQFGTGPVKGFAVTLLIGLAASVFTAFFVSPADS